MSDLAIKVESLSKAYKLYANPADRLKESLHPFRKKYHQDFYALKDVSFEVKKGEAFGIIGRNGSGKSTLLKLITGVLAPSSGNITVNGKISALLELGASFNPELSGIENVYFNCTLMGYTKKEIGAKLDDILSFADIGDFARQPVKIYSSGMFVRLAFAAAINIDPDILIVDEALAVGDALFQKRCFQQIEKLISNGTTLLFVSHDEETVRTLTHCAILLKEGSIKASGLSSDVVLEYRRQLHEDEKACFQDAVKSLNERVLMQENRTVQASAGMCSDRFSFGDLDASVEKVEVLDENNETKNVFYPGELIKIRITYRTYRELTHLNIGVRIRNKEGVKIYSWGTFNQDVNMWKSEPSAPGFWNEIFKEGLTFSVELMTSCSLGANLYEIQAFIAEEDRPFYGSQRIVHWRDEAAFFSVVVSQREYFFGGVCDLQMKAAWNC